MYRRADYAYALPDDRIAREPGCRRDGSRLLAVLRAETRHLQFTQVGALLEPGDLVVVNDTRVVKARLVGEKDSGGRAELLVERVLDPPERALCHVRVSKPLKPGRRVRVRGDDGDHDLAVIGRRGALYELRFPGPVHDFLARYGEVPLPPYIARAATPVDEARYQTVYARHPGAVAAPTAGLHFTQDLIADLERAGIGFAPVTLHVGAGTFQPMRTDSVLEHHMHSECYEVPLDTARRIDRTRAARGRVVAVGTTVVRALESSAESNGRVTPGPAETELFVTPGFRFQVVDALITNFHLPESTLLVLVCAFAGYRRVMDAYQAAIHEGYRFFSYGDAMFCERAR